MRRLPSWPQGATSTFSVSNYIGVTGGDISVQQLFVTVFPSAGAARAFLAQTPPPPPESVIRAAFGRPGWYVPDRVVCNALVGSGLILSKFVLPVARAAGSRVAADLRGRCAGTISVGVPGGRDPHAARLAPVTADLVRARSLLLTTSDLPGGFHFPNPNASAQLLEFTGKCDSIASPNLSDLVETATVSNPVLQNIDSGAQFISTAAVFASSAQAVKAQALEAGADDVGCGLALIKKETETIPHTITGQRSVVISRTIDGVTVRGREVIVAMIVKPNFRLQVEVGFVFFRHGRALSELRTSFPLGGAAGTPDPRPTWDDAVNAVARRLAHSGF